MIDEPVRTKLTNRKNKTNNEHVVTMQGNRRLTHCIGALGPPTIIMKKKFVVRSCGKQNFGERNRVQKTATITFTLIRYSCGTFYQNDERLYWRLFIIGIGVVDRYTYLYYVAILVFKSVKGEVCCLFFSYSLLSLSLAFKPNAGMKWKNWIPWYPWKTRFPLWDTRFERKTNRTAVRGVK